MGGSEYIKTIHGLVTGKIPRVDLEIHRHTIDYILSLIKNGLAASAQDISDGGLAVALAECCFANMIGAEIALDDKLRADSLLFGETQSRAIISSPPKNRDRITQMAAGFGVPIRRIGTTGGDRLKINDFIDMPIEKLIKIYEGTIPRLMEHVTADQAVATQAKQP